MLEMQGIRVWVVMKESKFETSFPDCAHVFQFWRQTEFWKPAVKGWMLSGFETVFVYSVWNVENEQVIRKKNPQ